MAARRQAEAERARRQQAEALRAWQIHVNKQREIVRKDQVHHFPPRRPQYITLQ